MDIFWGVILIVFTLLLCWLGQVISIFAPKLAVRMQLVEAESDVDPVFYADIRGEAKWDILILWLLPVAGILLILDNAAWAYFGLIGGGSYLYFAGRGIIVRLVMQRRGVLIGTPGNLKLFYVILGVWGFIAVVTIVLAVAELPFS